MIFTQKYIEIHNSIIIGKKYKIAGAKGSCGGEPCKECPNFVKGILVVSRRPLAECSHNRTIRGKSLTNDRSSCHFDPRDLKPILPNWKKLLGGVKK